MGFILILGLNTMNAFVFRFCVSLPFHFYGHVSLFPEICVYFDAPFLCVYRVFAVFHYHLHSDRHASSSFSLPLHFLPHSPRVSGYLSQHSNPLKTLIGLNPSASYKIIKGGMLNTEFKIVTILHRLNHSYIPRNFLFQ